MSLAFMLLVDGRFPAGGHTNSAGAEAAVNAGDIHDDVSLERHLTGRLATTGIVDAAFAANAAHAVNTSRDDDERRVRLAELDAEYSARTPSPRLRVVSRRLGRQLSRAASGVWNELVLDEFASAMPGPHQAVALGAVTASAGGDPHDAALLAVHHLSAAVTSAAIRLLGLDPVAVAAVSARVGEVAGSWIAEADAWALHRPSELPASSGSLTEILGEEHGRWDARMFVG